jgi:protein TonB
VIGRAHHPGSERARRRGSWLARGGGALLVSATAHAAAVVTIGGIAAYGFSSEGPAPRAAIDVDVDVDVPPHENAPGDLPSPAAGAVTPAPRRAPAPSRRTMAPHAPAPAAPARFAMSAGTVANAPAAAGATAPSPAAGPPSAEATAVGEGDVSVPARLLAAGPLVYPPDARQAEIEIDLPVEIVVDPSGRVVSARVLERAGYGLDEAALRALRGYRFSPAIRDGRAVAVRMRWTVQFRLR